MARIIYGVSGEGSGHSSRAKVIASYLEKQGHSVKIISYDRGYANLKGDFDVIETEGLHIASVDNKIDVIETFANNLKRLPQGFEKGSIIKQELFKDFEPHCVLTDLEPVSAYMANYYDLPLISIDNQHRLRYMEYECPSILLADKELTKSVIRGIVPRPDVSLVTTFYFGRVTNHRTFLFSPILRDEVLALKNTVSDHILVYLTSGFDSFLEMVGRFKRERFIVYGYDRDETVDNITYKQFSKEGFLSDFASCKAVMATAGFTLLTESLFLKKPYFAMPMKGQFEQEINGLFLESLGYGKNCRAISEEKIGSFLYHLPEYYQNLEHYITHGNSSICHKLDELLESQGELAKEFHKRRDPQHKVDELKKRLSGTGQ